MKTLATAFVYGAVLCGGLYMAFQPTFDSRFARTQTETGDGMLNHYILEHTWRAVFDPDYRGSLASPPCFFPTKWTIWYSEPLFGVAPAYWALRVAMPCDLAYQWWQIAMSGLNFVAFAVVARRLGCDHILTIGSAFVWAWGIAQVYYSEHQQMIPRFWMPVAVYYAWQFVTAPDLKPLNRMLAAVFLQSATCVYTAWFLVVGLTVFIPVAVVLSPGGCSRLWGAVRARKWAFARVTVLWTLALIAYFAPFVIVNLDTGRDYAECLNMAPTWDSWLNGPQNQPYPWKEVLRPHLPEELPHHECQLFSGFAIYLLMIVGGVSALVGRLLGCRRPELTLVAAAFLAALAWFLLTLKWGASSASAWEWARHVPGGQAIRVVGRVYVLVYLFGGLAGMVWANLATNRLSNRWLRWAVQSVISGALVFEQIGPVPESFVKEDYYPQAARVAVHLRGADAAYVLPHYGPNNVHGDIFAMWIGLYANVPVVNGYSGRYPTDFPSVNAGNPDHLRAWLRGRFRGRVAIIDPTHPEEVVYVDIE